MSGGRRRAAQVRRAELAVGLAAAGLLTAGLWPAAPVGALAATAAASVPPAQVWARSSMPFPGEVAPAVPPPLVDGSAAAVAAGPGLAVPQPPRPTGTGRVVSPHVGYGRPPELTERPAPCGGHGAPRRTAPGVAAGPGSATVSWQAGGRAGVLGYRVSAVSQTLVPGDQPVPVRAAVGQPAGCAPVTLTVAGLVSGGSYVFWLEEQMLDPTSQQVTFVQIGTSAAVVIP